jgi:hypothetical protein
VDPKEISFLSKLTYRRSKSFVIINKIISNRGILWQLVIVHAFNAAQAKKKAGGLK